MKNLQNIFYRIILIVLVFACSDIWGQVSITTPETNYTQDFNTLATSGASNPWTNNTTLTGWYSNRTTYNANNGAANAGGLYSYGTGTNSERALGSIGSGSANPVLYGWRLLNNTGAAVTSVTITYTGEQWRRANNVSHDLVVEYQIGATVDNITAGTWVGVSALTFTSPNTGATATALDGNAAANRVVGITETISVMIAPGDEIMIRWRDDDDTGVDHGLAIDDVTVSVTTGVLLPPVITSDLNTVGVVSQPFSYFITATNGANLFGAAGLPAGLTINTATGEISGTPTVAAVGTHYVVIRAENAAGFDERTLVLTITDPGPTINVRGASGGTNNIVNGNTIPNVFNNTLFAITSLGDFQDKDYRIQNLGTSNLLLTATPRVSIGGTHSADFTVTTQPAATIPALGDSVFVIRFSPTGAGVRTAIVTIESNDVTFTYTIQGTGLAPEIDVFGNGSIIAPGSTVTSLDNHTNFGNANVTSGTRIRNFYIMNTGGDDLGIALPVVISGIHASDFSVTAVPDATIVPGNGTLLQITFEPSALGLREATVTINNNVPAKNPYSFAISGVGIDFDECQLSSFSNIRIQNFETGANWNYTVDLAHGAIPPVVAGGQAYGNSRSTQTNKYVNNNSLQVTGPYTTSEDQKAKTTITFDTFDVSQYAEVEFRMNIGAYSTNTTQGLDVSDWVTVFVSVDGGTTWSREAIVKGQNNSIWAVNTGGNTFTGVYKGIDIPYEMNSPNNSIGQGTRLLTISSLPLSENLRIKIELDVDRNDEVWVIDNLYLRVRTPLSTTWNGSTWSAGAPNTYTRAIFNGNYNTNTNGNVTACECQINNNRTVTVTQDGYLDIGGKINIDGTGTLLIQNGGSLIQHDDYTENTGTGNYRMNRETYMRRLDYVYWSSPSRNFPVLSISPLTPASVVWHWIPTQVGNFGTWQNTSENMIEGKGYIVRGPGTFNNTPQLFSTQFTGIFNNGIITPDIERGSYTGSGYPSPTNPLVTVTNLDDNLNLIGNPYPSAIRALDFLTENTNIEGAVRIWTHGYLPQNTVQDPFYGSFAYNYDINDYIVHNGTGTLSGPSGFNGYIAAGQAFFVIMNDGSATTEQVVFKNSMRNILYDNNQFYRTANNTNREDFKIWLDLVSEAGQAFRTLIGYVDGATLEKDRLFDAYIKEEGGTSFYSLIEETERMTIQGRPAMFDNNDRVLLGFNASETGEYKIAIGHLQGLLHDMNIYLEDLLLDTIHNLSEQPYSFLTEKGRFENRFVLKFTSETLTVVDNNLSEQDVIVFKNQDVKIISKTEDIKAVSVFDLLGRNVFTRKNINHTEFSFDLSHQASQTYLIKIALQNGNTVTKKLVF